MTAGGRQQRDITSFFAKPSGSKHTAAAAGSTPPGSSTNGTSVPAKPAAVGKARTEKPSQTKAESAASEPARAAPLKRLKKADNAAELAHAGAKRKQAEASAANELDDDLSDAVSPTGPAATEEAVSTPEPAVAAAEPAAASLAAVPPAEETAASPKAGSSPKRRKRGAVPATAAAATGSPAGSAVSGDGDEAAGSESEASSASEGEAEAEKGDKTPKKKPVKKAILKKTGLEKKVDGVGLGAVAAAAKHETVDVKSLITWQPGAPVPFAFLAKTWEEIADESKRLAITQLLTNALRAILASTPADLLPALYLCTGRVAPSHEGIELGVGDSILVKALAEATGRSVKEIQKQYEREGDLGTVAAAARGKQKPMFPPPPLTVAGVHSVFLDIARTEGNKSQDKKRQLINKLLVAAGQNEAGYIMRCLQGKLRIGLAEQTVLVSLAQAALLHEEGKQEGIRKYDAALAGRLEQAAQAVKLAYSQCPSFAVLIPAILEHGPMGLSEVVKFQPGVPVKPMLAKPMTGVSEVLDKFQDTPFTCEYKYDGERAQVHILEDGSVKVYSRNSEDNTSKYPDIAASIPRLLKPGVCGLVLDCEVVAYDREAKKLLPFQRLSTRARKDVKVEDITVQVILYAFDCLYRGGETLIQKPLTERRAALYDSIEQKEGELMYASTKESADLEELGVFLNESVAAGTEGLIVKSLDSTYEPSRRSVNWLKLKKDYMDSVGDTFDVVPIGAWFGRGKRKGVYGAYLLAVYNEEEEQFQTISKIGTGFSEQLLIDLAESLKPAIIPAPKPYYRYGGGTLWEPDVWFDTSQVWEVKAADLSISPRHMAAIGMLVEDKGISIRFPRLVKVRDDKTPEQATTATQVVEMYQAQAIHNTTNGKKGGADDDEY